MRMKSGLLIAFAALMGGLTASGAAAQLRVIRSTSTAQSRYPVGIVIPTQRVLTLRRGEALTLVSLRTGRTYRVNGPRRGTVAAMVGRQWRPDENRPAVRASRSPPRPIVRPPIPRGNQ